MDHQDLNYEPIIGETIFKKRESIEINQMVREEIRAAYVTKDYFRKELIHIYKTNIKF